MVNSLIATESNKNENNMRVLNYDEVKDSLIRFHVIANSDNDDDQQLKLKVKNRVIDYLYPYLNSSQSLDESRKIIKDKMEDVKTLAQEVIKDNNYDYDVKVELSRENFPDKSYGNITLPQGNYEAFRIIIGSGQGRNWWCVMFPPLCFVDESKAQVEYDKTENKIKSNGKSFGLESKDDSTENVEDKQADGNNIKIKFKIVEIFRDIFK
nr:stage II sporulation protein R [Clostridium beijerinckii]